MQTKNIRKNKILNDLKNLKSKYRKDGFLILGLFGSYSRDEATKNSDIDILYDLDDKLFISKYRGWDYFIRLDEIKDELEKFFDKKIDIADKETLNNIGKKYILQDLIYV